VATGVRLFALNTASYGSAVAPTVFHQARALDFGAGFITRSRSVRRSDDDFEWAASDRTDERFGTWRFQHCVRGGVGRGGTSEVCRVGRLLRDCHAGVQCMTGPFWAISSRILPERLLRGNRADYSIGIWEVDLGVCDRVRENASGSFQLARAGRCRARARRNCRLYVRSFTPR